MASVDSVQSPDPEPVPRILPRAEHGISRKLIDRDALWVLYQLHNAGHLAYLVGGSVRDLLAGRTPKDYDIGTSATPEQVRKLIRRSRIIGKRFRLVQVPFGPKKVVEVSTFRKLLDAAPPAPPAGPGPDESPEAAPNGGAVAGTAEGEKDLLIRDDNLYGTPREDAFRRDFTVNALFYNIADFSVIDHVGGLPDLAARVVRSIGDPSVRYREDPVRMIRAVKLAARLGFSIADGDLAAIRAHKEEIRKSPPSRVVEECFRILEQGACAAATTLLWDLDLFGELYPALVPAMRDDAKRAEILSRLGHLDASGMAKLPGGRALAFTTLVSPHVEEVMAAARGGHAANWAEAAKDAIDAVGGKLPFPRFDRATALHILATQRRIERPPPAKGRPPRFIERPYFSLAVAYFRIRLAAAGADPAPADAWARLARPYDPQAHRHQEQRERRDRRPHGRRGPGSPQPGSPGNTTEGR